MSRHREPTPDHIRTRTIMIYPSTPPRSWSQY
nr:MAG TPA: hypothetical protein [Podoviridae sp. ctfN46]